MVIELERLQKENKTLKHRVSDLEIYFDDGFADFEERFTDLEKSVANCEQYTRRENFEICGIPEEELGLDIVNIVTHRRAGNHILNSHIHACH